MGIQVIVPGAKPENAAQATREMGLPLRLVDNLPAFPDEAVPEAFEEIRVAAETGMISIRSGAEGLILVVWGNADLSLRERTGSLAARLAELSDGAIIAAGRRWDVGAWLAAGFPLQEV